MAFLTIFREMCIIIKSVCCSADGEVAVLKINLRPIFDIMCHVMCATNCLSDLKVGGDLLLF